MSEDKLKLAFKTVLALPNETDYSTLRYRGIPQWDSVAHMLLVSEIELAFDIMLDTDEVLNLSSYLKAKEILSKHAVRFDA